MTRDALIEAFAQSIATEEGFYRDTSLAARNNNPGNLRSWGDVPVVGGYAKFPAVGRGWAALHAQIEKNVFVRKLTFREFFGGKPGVYAGFSPAADKNQPEAYARFVQSRVAPKATIDTVIETLVEES